MQTTAMMISRLRIATRETGRSKLIDQSAVFDSAAVVYMSIGFKVVANMTFESIVTISVLDAKVAAERMIEFDTVHI